jgi:amino acid adenylation domain-containing protein
MDSSSSGAPPLRPIEDVFPLTRMQQALLVRCLSFPDSPLFLGQWWAVLAGDLDVDALAAAWQGVIDRHTALRCGFHWDLKDHPFQVVHRQAPLDVHRAEWPDDGNWRARLDAYLAADRTRPFDLKRPPLTRIAIIRIAPARHLMIWTRHHLTVDGWSLGLILDQVFALYKARRASTPHGLSTAPSYRSYVDWERAQNRATALAHWREILGDATADAARASNARVSLREAAAPEIRVLGRQLSSAAEQRLAVLARTARVTVNTVVQAAWALVDSRMSGNDIALFGSVETVRPPQVGNNGRADLVGMQIQILPVFARIDDTPLVPWLEALQAAMVAGRNAGAIGMDGLREVLGLPHDCLPFESLVGFQNYPLDEAAAFAGSGLTLAESGDVTLPDMPLNLMIEPRQGHGLSISLMFDRLRQSERQADFRLQMLEATLELLPDAAEQPVSTIDALPRAVVERRLADVCSGTPLAPSGRTVIDRIVEQAERRPDATAVRYGGQGVSYATLLSCARMITARLAERGIGRGARVGVHLERSPLAIAAILGVLLRGGSYVPLDVDAPDERKTAMFADAQIAGVLTAGGDTVAGLSSIAIGDLDFATGRTFSGGAEACCQPTGQDEAYVIFTSGSTGRPKGVSIGHDNLGYHVEARMAAYHDHPVRAALLTFPLIFDGSVVVLFGALVAGGAVILPRPLEAADPDRLAALIRSEGVTHTVMIPSQWSLVLAAANAGDFASLAMASVAGEACPPDLVERHYSKLPRSVLCNEYGPTESTIWATVERCTPTDGPTSVSIGRPIPGARTYVVDRHNRLCPPGTVGELLIAGPGIARGYVGRADLTAERFTPNPFHNEPGFNVVYRTGDRVLCDFDGRLFFNGRSDDQVKVSGYRIELAEIAACLQQHPEIDEAAVVVHRTSEQAPARIVAHVAGANLPSREAILRHAQRSLPSYMIPHTVMFHDRLPHNATGKVDRRQLPEPKWQEVTSPPEGEIEQGIARIWQSVLGCPEVGRFSDFFTIGGGSLAAMQVVSRLRRELRLEAEMIDLLECPRLSDFAERVAGARTSQAPAIVKRQRVRVDLNSPAVASGDR